MCFRVGSVIDGYVSGIGTGYPVVHKFKGCPSTVLSSSRKGYPLQFQCFGSTWKPSVRVVGALGGDSFF